MPVGSSSESVITVKVMFEDTDCTGRVHFSKYAVWIDNGIVNFFVNKGFVYDRDGTLKDGKTGERLAFAVGEYYVRMEKPSKLGDVLEVTVKPVEVRRRVVVFEGRLKDASSGDVLAHGRITLVHIDPVLGKSKDMPEWLVERITSGKNRI